MTTWVQFWQTFQEVFRYTWAHMVWINLVLAIIIIFFQRKEAKSAWAWLLALNVLPGLGFLMYLLAGTDMHKRKMFKIKGIEEQINDAVRRQEYSVKSRELEQDLIRDGENGFLVPVDDSDALADRLTRLLENPDLMWSFLTWKVPDA